MGTIIKQHICSKRKYRSTIRIALLKEAIDGTCWNIEIKEDEGIYNCFHINFCPFCGTNLNEEE